MHELSFSIQEILSLIGLIQCVYIMVHMIIRRIALSEIALPLSYFCALGCAFFLDFGDSKISDLTAYYHYLQWFFWFIGPLLSALLILKFASLKDTLAFQNFSILLMLPCGALMSVLIVTANQTCSSIAACFELEQYLNLTGIIAGTLSFLIIFGQPKILSRIRKQKSGEEKYWLSVSFIIMNLGFIALILAYLSQLIAMQDMVTLRSLLGLGFVYIVATSILRVYPKTHKEEDTKLAFDALSQKEKALVKTIERLMTYEKVYQEPQYSRRDLADECQVSEVFLSKILNHYFQKPFPQMINEYRIKDAKLLLAQTDAPINVISQDAGFRSLATFNRVFKDYVGQSPSAYRKSTQKRLNS